jgi:pimeloyl-ACP methyl ester carboxylesterase
LDFGFWIETDHPESESDPVRSSGKATVIQIAIIIFAIAAAAPGQSAPPGRLIDVGGRNLHLYCTGGGAGPTIVLEAGGGDGFHTWYAVQPRLSKEFRVCSYDRAGFGFSDPRPGQRSIAGIVEDLDTLLGRAHEKPPYILIGHSLGGQFAWKFAEAHGGEVLGLVLADSNLPGSEKRRPREVNETFTAARNRVRGERLRKIEEGRKTGHWEEIPIPGRVPAGLRESIAPLTKTAKWWEARYAEGELPDIEEPFKRINVPVVILVATRRELPGLGKDIGPVLVQASLDEANEVARLSPRGSVVKIDADHLFIETQPDVVIDALRRVLAAHSAGP